MGDDSVLLPCVRALRFSKMRETDASKSLCALSMSLCTAKPLPPPTEDTPGDEEVSDSAVLLLLIIAGPSTVTPGLNARDCWGDVDVEGGALRGFHMTACATRGFAASMARG